MNDSSPEYVLNYDGSERRKAVLRWSLWEAMDRKCYLCNKYIEPIYLHIDHVIPRSLPAKRFKETIDRVAPDLGEFEVDYIYNLRPCCSGCNGSSFKGSKTLGDAQLDIILQGSKKLREGVVSKQKRLDRESDLDFALVSLARADISQNSELLSQPAVVGALQETVFESISDRSRRDKAFNLNSERGDHIVTSDREGFQTLSAMHILVGMSSERYVSEMLSEVERKFDSGATDYLERQHLASLGAFASAGDWMFDEFHIENLEIESSNGLAFISGSLFFKATVDAFVSMQSEDGGDLVTQQSSPIAVQGSCTFRSQVSSADGEFARGVDIEIIESEDLNYGSL